MEQTAAKQEKQKALGDMIEGRMYEKRWTITRLSRESRISRAALYKIFKGQQVTMNTYLQVCAALDLELTITKN